MAEEPAVVKLVYITTVPQSLRFLRGQVGYMKAMGFDAYALSSPGELLRDFAVHEQVPVYAVNMPRRITPLHDLAATYRIWQLLHNTNPQIVHTYTPKGGLLGMVGAWLAQVPVRIYHILGLPLVTAKGHKRRVLCWSEKTACLLAHQVFCVSHSVRNLVIAEGLCPERKIRVLVNGSINGVDAKERFNPERLGGITHQNVREKYGIPAEALVIGFLGRIVRDKGLIELTEAWKVLRESFH